MVKRLAFTFAAIVASLVAASAGAAAPNSAVPVPGAPNCQGHLFAISNHASGAYGASGNEKASAGPGYFLGSSTHEESVAYTAEYCG